MANQGDGAEMTWGSFSGTSELNGDLLIQILLRLPVVSILRFKSVCKAWYALFSSSEFIQHHSRVANSSAKITNLLSFFIHADKTEGNGHIFSLFRDRSCGNPILKELNPPFGVDSEDIQVVGSINGLVCLDLYDNATSILLWNPATRKHSQIPHPQLSLASDEYVSIGFAYDENTDSYKVIRILYSNFYATKRVPVKVEIYSTETNTWRAKVVADFPSLADQKTCGAVVNGSPYWYADDCQDPVSQQVILWFDASVEAFRFQPLKPMQLGDIRSRKINFGGMGEHPVAFCITYSHFRQLSATVLDIWKLNKCDDDGGSDVIEFEKLMIKPISGSVGIAGFGRNGEFIVSDEGNNVVIYDPHSAEMKSRLPGGGIWGWSPKVCDYTETLVSPRSRLT